MDTNVPASKSVTVQRQTIVVTSAGGNFTSSHPINVVPNPSNVVTASHSHSTAMCSVRSMSVASISSEGSTESHGVEQEEIAALTHDVRNFKEALTHLRRVFHSDREFQESVSVTVHERLGDVLRILRTVLEKHPVLQHTELLMAAGSLIQQVKGYDYEDEKANPKEFYDAIDQLALAFGKRLPEYLMGDLDASVPLSSSVSSKTKSYETLAGRPGANRSWGRTGAGAGEEGMCSEQQEPEFVLTDQSVDALFRLAKSTTKYMKDICTYVEKKSHLDLEYAKNLAKLAQTVRPCVFSEETFLPLRSTYCTALDHDIENVNRFQVTSAHILGAEYLDPMNARRAEHERRRKELKEQWQRELKRLQETEVAKRKSHALFVQRQQTVRATAPQSEMTENLLSQSSTSKYERRRKGEDEALQKAGEAEDAYKTACMELEERILHFQRVKSDITNRLQSLLLQNEQTVKLATVNYFQQQLNMSSYAPAQFQTLLESSSQHEPGLQYHDYVKRFCALTSQKHAPENYSSFVGNFEREPRSTDSLNMETDFSLNPLGPEGKSFSKKAWSSSSHQGLGSDTDSSQSTKSREPSPTNIPASMGKYGHSSAEEIQGKTEAEYHLHQSTGVSTASESHKFRKIKGSNVRCPECDTKLYQNALECAECGFLCHKECTKTVTIQCGPTRLPERMCVFGADLAQHLKETKTNVPHILNKCIKEIDETGLKIKGIYRISGVKSKVEKLVHDFEISPERVDLSGINAHVIASVLKLYLRQLPEPLLTFKLYPHFVRLAKDWPAATDDSTDLSELQELVSSLPLHNRHSLQLLMQHLYRVAAHAEINSMPPSNLGIVFGPTLLRTAETNSSMSCLADTVHQTKAIELLIIHTCSLFPSSSSILINKVLTADNLPLDVALPGFINESNAATNLSSPDYDPNSSQADDQILGFTSDEELPESLLPDCSPAVPTSPLLQRNVQNVEDEVPVIFRTALRDYKGLEGADSDSLILNLPESTEISSHNKMKKLLTDNEAEKRGKCQKNNNTNEQSYKISPPGMIARVESLADSDFESHLSSSLESPSPKDNEDEDGKQRGDSSKDPSAPTSSLEESHSEGEKDDYGVTSSILRRTTTLPSAHKVQHDEIKGGQSPPTSNTGKKHHFNVVTNLVGRRSLSLKSVTSHQHHVETCKANTSQCRITEESSVKSLVAASTSSSTSITTIQQSKQIKTSENKEDQHNVVQYKYKSFK